MSRDLIEKAREIKRQMMASERKLEAPEFDIDGAPLTIYVKPVTNRQLQRLFAEKDIIKRAALTIELRALDKSGAQLFRNESEDIIREFPPKLIIEMAGKINDDLTGLFDDTGAVEEVQENIDAAGE
jgi:hypothetical protein